MSRSLFIASTGRTATTYLAAGLNRIETVIACHEGYAGSSKDAAPVLPLINLENRQAYHSESAARKTVELKRSPTVLNTVREVQRAEKLVDVAYYNATLACELLTQNPDAGMIGIIRNCEEFVRSCTTITGEDLLPVGWPDASKLLSAREKFISYGRIAPKKDSDESKQWDKWSAIQKNIWLWQETNQLLIDAQQKFPNRMVLVSFSSIRENEGNIIHSQIADILGIKVAEVQKAFSDSSEIDKNRKPHGYQVGDSKTWGSAEYSMLMNAMDVIGSPYTPEIND